MSDKYEAIVTAEHLNALADRYERWPMWNSSSHRELIDALRAASGLPAEIARLRAEVERLNLELASMHNRIEQYEPAKYSTETGNG